MTASELKIGDTFRRYGTLYTVSNLRPDTYKNGNPCILVDCTANDSKIVNSHFEFRPSTKVK